MTPRAILLTAAIVTAFGSVSAMTITTSYTDGGINGGVLTFTDLGSNQLQIDINNTSQNDNVGAGAYLNSSVITGFVFDIDDDISAFSIDSFVDGDGFDLTSTWIVELDVNNNITPGGTQVDLSFKTTNGINSGVYNDASTGTNIDNVVPDEATLVLTVTDPTSWSLSSISNDILRMQRVGFNGNGSLKLSGSSGIISTTTSTGLASSGVPVPGPLSLLGIGLVSGLFFYRRQRTRGQAV